MNPAPVWTEGLPGFAEPLPALPAAGEGPTLPPLEEVLDCLPCAVIICDDQGRILGLNRPATLFLAEDVAPGMALEAVSEPALGKALLLAVQESFGQGFALPRRVELDLGGTKASARLSGSLARSVQGDPSAVLVVQDATAQEELARREGRELRARDLVAEVAHELRAPLTSVIGYLELAEPKSEGARPMIERARRAAARLAAIVTDILDQSRIEQRSMHLRCERTSMEALVAHVVQGSSHLVRNGVTLTTRVPPHLPPVMCDPGRMERALVNLIDNAIKYSPQGGTVTVAAARVDELLEVSVTDQGIGIAPEDIPRMFERHFRPRNSAVRAIPGGGLGLAIVKSIVEAHGGAVGVVSELGKGSSFRIRLPIAPNPV